MIECLNCGEALKLVIDLKDDKYTCRECGEEYNLDLRGKSLIINKSDKSVYFHLINFSSCNEGFGNNIVYELYNKGYVNCKKVLNTDFYNHESDWMLDLNELRNNLMSEFQHEVRELDEKINRTGNEAGEKYSCTNCSMTYGFDEAVKSDFSCNVCSSTLKREEKEEAGVKELKDKKSELKNNLSILTRGWLRTINQ